MDSLWPHPGCGASYQAASSWMSPYPLRLQQPVLGLTPTPAPMGVPLILFGLLTPHSGLFSCMDTLYTWAPAFNKGPPLRILELWHQAPRLPPVWMPSSLYLGYRTLFQTSHMGAWLFSLSLWLPEPGCCPVVGTVPSRGSASLPLNTLLSGCMPYTRLFLSADFLPCFLVHLMALGQFRRRRERLCT